MQIIHDLPPLATAKDVIAIDTEWFGMDKKRLHRPISGTFACATFCNIDNPDIVYFADQADRIPEAIRRVTPARQWVMQNAQFDITQLRRLAVIPRKQIHDTMLIEQALYSGYYETFSLKAMMRRYFGEIIDKEARDQFTGSNQMTPQMVEYACRDTESTARIKIEQDWILEDKQRYVAFEIDEPMIWATVDFKGFLMDCDSWLVMAKTNQAEADRLKESFDFNPNSPAQALSALHKSGLRKLQDTNEKTLTRYKDRPLVAALLAYRKVAKLTSTYGEKFLEWVEPDGRIHTHYKIIGALTGRLASDDPAMQNIPSADCFRCNFIAAPGHVLVKGDYQAQEPRTLAFRSQDATLLEIVNSGRDIHTETARLIFNDQSIQKSDIRRKKAKAIGLGLDYGLTYIGLMQARSLTSEGIFLEEDEAKDLILRYFDVFPGVRDCINDDRRFAREHEYVETILGRRCWVNLHSYKAMNNAINSPVQGSGADMTKIAHRRLHEDWPSEFGPFGTVETTHDSISIEVPQEMTNDAVEFLRSCMLSATKKVCPGLPFEVDISIGKSWGKEEE